MCFGEELTPGCAKTNNPLRIPFFHQWRNIVGAWNAPYQRQMESRAAFP